MTLGVTGALLAASTSVQAIVIPPFGDLTNFATSATVLTGNPGPVGGVSAADGLVGDDLTDGAINISTNESFAVGFSGGILNGVGNDLVIFDSRFSADGVFMTVNGTELLIGAGDFVDTGLVLQLKGTVFRFSLFGATVDLSAFGVAAGDTINNLSIRGTGQSDIMGIASLRPAGPVPAPAPATGLLAAIALAGLVFTRRRRR